MSELKEFSGKDDDENRARAWIGKVKSAFVRDQAPDTKNAWCLVACSLDRRATVQLCGLGLSVARQYYHARKRADETPVEYLHRLNVAGLRVKLRVKSGLSDVRREHVKHFIETLDDRDLADQLALLRISDADALEEALRARQRAKNRQGRVHFGSSKYRQKAACSDATKSAPARKSQMAIYAGSTWLQRKESRNPKRRRQTNPIEPCLAKLRHRETPVQARDIHTDALSSSAALTAAHTAMTICTAGRG
ncbi:hypothetical protein F443_22370 [Phytophthora nicotianae P1569]|uniref:Uncharacterized protein n=1 Tax=Phytophthora nicotianae P1569 TaxID=1317065 RepID=V9DWX6_PHYNI|nr:hypothetical protein F443_22370 [Phytophthora nicotianae P1569]